MATTTITEKRPFLKESEDLKKHWTCIFESINNSDKSYSGTVIFNYKVNLKRTFWDWLFRRFPTETKEFQTEEVHSINLFSNDEKILLCITEKDQNRFMELQPSNGRYPRLSEMSLINNGMYETISISYEDVVSISFTELEPQEI